MYKIGAHFGQYFEYLSQKLGEDQKKRSSLQIGADFGQYYGNLSQKVGEDQKKRSSPQIRTDFGKTKQKKVWFGPFYFPENAK